MSTNAPTERKIVVCPVCWKTISLKKWDSIGCCLSPAERGRGIQ